MYAREHATHTTPSRMASVSPCQVKAVRCVTLVSIIALLLLSVYYLNATLEAFKMLIEHVHHADRMLERNLQRNSTLAKLMFVPLHRSAHEYYLQTEPKLIMNIVSYSALVFFSITGVVSTIRGHTSMLIVHGVCLTLIYCTSFLYSSRLNPSICAFIVFVSLLSFIHARQLWLVDEQNQQDRTQSSKATPLTNVSALPTTKCLEVV